MTGTTWTGDICQCQRQKIKATMICMILEDTRELYGPGQSQEETIVGSLMTMLHCCFCAQRNRVSGTSSGSNEDFSQEVRGFSS